jgi:hypothetical protein
VKKTASTFFFNPQAFEDGEGMGWKVDDLVFNLGQ